MREEPTEHASPHSPRGAKAVTDVVVSGALRDASSNPSDVRGRRQCLTMKRCGSWDQCRASAGDDYCTRRCGQMLNPLGKLPILL